MKKINHKKYIPDLFKDEIHSEPKVSDTFLWKIAGAVIIAMLYAWASYAEATIINPLIKTFN